MTPEKRLEAAMKKLGLTRQQLADTLGISLSSVAMYFTGHHKVRRVIALAMQAACGISADWIMTGKGGMMMPEKELPKDVTEVARMFDKLSSQHKNTARAALLGFHRLKDDIDD